MNQSHEDRVADRPPHLCAAYDCPLNGSMSSSIGSDEWYCPCHFGQAFGAMQAITAEINRNPLLVRCINEMRAGALMPRRQWIDIGRRIKADLAAEKLDDLAPIPGERAGLWMARIELELRKRCWVHMVPAPPPTQAEAFTQVQFDIPEF